MANEAARERRQKQREVVDLLQSDLYKRVAWPEEYNGMAWESPLNWRVEITGTMEGDYQPLVIRIVDPKGEEYAKTDDGTAKWLHATLP